MKALVLSDSHGFESTLSGIIMENIDADTIIFLGDGMRDFDNALAENEIDEYNGGKDIYRVRGNCDRFSTEPVTIVINIAGVRVLVTHGFDQNVKYGFQALTAQARQRECKAALFGHTHCAYCNSDSGITLFNPGTAGRGCYGIITDCSGRLVFELKKY